MSSPKRVSLWIDKFRSRGNLINETNCPTQTKNQLSNCAKTTIIIVKISELWVILINEDRSKSLLLDSSVTITKHSPADYRALKETERLSSDCFLSSIRCVAIGKKPSPRSGHSIKKRLESCHRSGNAKNSNSLGSSKRYKSI